METEKLALFVSAVDAGSLSAAAARTSTLVSTISRHVADLERELGTRLLERTGRGVRPTPAGERFLEHAREVLLATERALAAGRGASPREPTRLRLSVPPDFAHSVLPGVLAALAARHRDLSVEVRAEARRVSVIEESYDAVVRLGPLSSSDLLARKLGSVSLFLCARPGVEVKGARGLAQAEVVLVDGMPDTLHARRGARSVRIAITGRLRMTTFRDAAEVAACSDAVVLLPSTSAAPFLRDGRLHRVARDLRFPPAEVHLLRPARLRGSVVLDELCALLTAKIAETA